MSCRQARTLGALIDTDISIKTTSNVRLHLLMIVYFKSEVEINYSKSDDRNQVEIIFRDSVKSN